jgi:hypothetical protein
MAFPLTTPKPSLTIRSMLISMIPIIRLMSLVTLSLERREQGRLLIVSYTERSAAIRLISARELTSTEREAYEEN